MSQTKQNTSGPRSGFGNHSGWAGIFPGRVFLMHVHLRSGGDSVDTVRRPNSALSSIISIKSRGTDAAQSNSVALMPPS
jgi:hypothetical protein